MYTKALRKFWRPVWREGSHKDGQDFGETERHMFRRPNLDAPPAGSFFPSAAHHSPNTAPIKSPSPRQLEWRNAKQTGLRWQTTSWEPEKRTLYAQFNDLRKTQNKTRRHSCSVASENRPNRLEHRARPNQLFLRAVALFSRVSRFLLCADSLSELASRFNERLTVHLFRCSERDSTKKWTSNYRLMCSLVFK